MAIRCATCDRRVEHEMAMRQCRVCVATEIQATEFGIPREVARKVARDRVDGPSLPEELAEDCVR